MGKSTAVAMLNPYRCQRYSRCHGATRGNHTILWRIKTINKAIDPMAISVKPILRRNRFETEPVIATHPVGGASTTIHPRWHAMRACKGGPQPHGPQIACPKSMDQPAIESDAKRHPPQETMPVESRSIESEEEVKSL